MSEMMMIVSIVFIFFCLTCPFFLLLEKRNFGIERINFSRSSELGGDEAIKRYDH